MEADDLFAPPPASLKSEPKHRVVAWLPGPDDAVSTVAALIDAGLPADDVWVLCGDEGARRLDPTGRHHGLKSRLIRATQAAASAGGLIADDAAHLEAGGVIVTAPARDPEERKLAQHILREHGASEMRYFGSLTWEEVS
jgi:hypothetical protein